MGLWGISSCFQLLSPSLGQIIHVLLTRPPLTYTSFTPEGDLQRISPLDLHVLGTPPAFILSQDQTLKLIDLIAYALSGVLLGRILLPASLKMQGYPILFNVVLCALAHVQPDLSFSILSNWNDGFLKLFSWYFVFKGQFGESYTVLMHPDQ